jgi:hypothetical protein
MADRDRPLTTPGEQVSRLYEEAEAHAARASEQVVGGKGFAVTLARLAENAAAMTKLSSDAMDLVLHNLRVAGRRDVVRLARQLARTEDKLERVLQEVEALRHELASARAEGSGDSLAPVKAAREGALRGSTTSGAQRGKSS